MESITPARIDGDPIFRQVPLKDRILARIYDTAQYWITYYVASIFISFVLAIITPSSISYSHSLAIIFAAGWFLLRDGLTGGANFGKSNREIMVVCIDTNQECTIARSFARNIISDISAVAIFIQFAGMIPIALIYLIVLAVDIWRIAKLPGGRRIGDVIAKTQVVYMDDWILFQQSIRQKQKALATA